VNAMTQVTYRVAPRRGLSCQVEAAEAGAAPQWLGLGCFNLESEAWGWITEQERVAVLTDRRSADSLLKP
jgi:hypothetical protein